MATVAYTRTEDSQAEDSQAEGVVVGGAREGLSIRLSQDLDGAFTDLVAQHQRAVYATGLRLSGRPAEAADLAADTFLRAYVALRAYTPERIAALRLRPWLVTIVLNLWRNQARANGRRPAQVGLDGAAEIPSREATPDQEVEHGQDRDRLGLLVTRLPPRQRAAVVLRHVTGLSYPEVAAVLACPETTVRSHVRRGLGRLRQLMSEAEVEEDRR